MVETLFFPGNVHSNDLGVDALDILGKLRFEDLSDPNNRTGPNESIVIARWRNNPGKVPEFFTESRAVQWENVNWDLFRERFQTLKDTLTNC